MSESIGVRQSKVYIIFVSISAIFIMLFFVELSILALYRIICHNTVNISDYFGDIIGLCFSSLCFTIITLMFVCILLQYKKQRDIYSTDKMIRERGEKIIFELPYKNIVSIKEGFFSVFMVLKTHII